MYREYVRACVLVQLEWEFKHASHSDSISPGDDRVLIEKADGIIETYEESVRSERPSRERVAKALYAHALRTRQPTVDQIANGTSFAHISERELEWFLSSADAVLALLNGWD